MLKEGDKAPDFCLKGIGEEGEERDFCLHDFSGQDLILYFYPKDNTPGCTQEACDFRDNFDHLISQGYKVIGISPDSLSSHMKFKEKYSLGFLLLSDKDCKVAELYGAYGTKKMYGKETRGIIRSTFVIDKAGIIKKAYYNVKAKGHVERLLQEL